MTVAGWVTIFGFVVILTVLALGLGRYMAAVYTGGRTWLDPVLRRPERLLYRAFRTDPNSGQDWKAYAKSVIIFSFVGWVVLYFILRTQTLWDFTGLNPMHFHSAPWNVTFNTTSSFVTNTNWQFYGGETTMSNFSQMAGLTVQNFLSAAVGITVAVALIRGIVGRSGKSLGNFWQDLIRTILYILLPLSIVVGLVLVFQGSIQTFGNFLIAHGLTSGGAQTIARGPVASQEAIKLLGTNGGGFFNVNSAHPFENPTAFTNFLEMLAVLVIPAGAGVRLRPDGRQPPPGLRDLLDDDDHVPRRGDRLPTSPRPTARPPSTPPACTPASIHGSTGGNLEGKEQRFGIAGSALYDVVTTVTSCGAVNSAIESFTGIGGAVPFANLSASEVIFGGVGTGLYSILLYVLLAVFIGGLMVGRTPEYLGKKIEAREIKLVTLGLLLTPLAALFSTALATASQRRPGVDLRGRRRPAGLLGDVLRLPQPGQQQRLGVRRLHRLHPAQRRQPRLPRHRLRRSARRVHDAVRPLRADPVRARHRRLAGRQTGQPAGAGDDAHRQPHLRGAADRRDRARRRADLLPRPAARTDRPGPDRTPLLMKRTVITSVLSVLVLTLALGIVYPLVMTGVSQVAFPGNANGQQITRNGKLVGSKIIGQQFTDVGPQGQRQAQARRRRQPGDHARQALLPDPPVRDASRPTTPPRPTFANLGPNDRATEQAIAANVKAYLALERPYDPGLTVAAASRRRRRHLGLGRSTPTSRRPTPTSRPTGSPRSAISPCPP